MIEKWNTIHKEELENLKIFKLQKIRRQNPKWIKQSDFYVLESPTWVNIIPLTRDNKIILVEQYRHGIDDITLEIPGGLVEINEEPIIAAKRECTEETGYSSIEEPELIGINLPNPAFLDNKCYSYLWKNCSKTNIQELDSNEDIEIHELKINEIKSMINNKKIMHSLTLTAFFYYSLKYNF